ncbi:MAG: phenylalanine--tRNA ligase subunit beta [Dehalococcoidia bacterium]
MKVPLSWLRDYVDVTIPVEELAEKLTLAGLEVGEIQTLGGSWDHVVVGEIVSIDPHPNADRLRLATIGVGSEQITVVCGAPNLVIGDKVPFARVGAKLIDSHTGEQMELKPAKIRGVRSEGMVCSERELGISDMHEGIMVLSPNAAIGSPLSECIGDTVLDIDVTPNRPDCLSIVGIAREVAALTGSPLHIPEIAYEESGDDIHSLASVEIADPELCPRYCASVLTGVTIAPSPDWMQQRLLACGMRPINNVVDVTNYVMMEYGQPLHAFDYEELSGRQIIVRRAGDGEVMVTLDGAERTLDSEFLLITDCERAVAIAGVMGGENSEVTPGTTSVLIESATFNQVAIHRGSVELKLVTEASLRFEKGLSRELPMVVLKRATQLMQELTGARVAKGVIDVYPGKQEVERITLMNSELKRLLGIEVDIKETIKTLESLGFICDADEKSGQVKVTVPWWRTDVTCDADLVEEVARLIGYDNIPETMMESALPVYEPEPIIAFKQRIRELLASCGLQEIITYSLTNIEMLKKTSAETNLIVLEPMSVANPMSRELEYLRTTLRTGILSTLARNQRYQFRSMKLFELGRIYLPQKAELPEEKEMVCIALCGPYEDLFWRDGEPATVDFFITKGIVETFLSQLGLTATFTRGEDEGLSPAGTARISVDDNDLGIIGELHPVVASQFDLDETTFIVEMDVNMLLSLTQSLYRYKPVNRYPGIIRDLAIVADIQIDYQQAYDIINDFPLVRQVNLFDMYSGEQVPQGKKSLAFRVVYQSDTQTLTDEDVDKVQERILARLAKELGATLRA